MSIDRLSAEINSVKIKISFEEADTPVFTLLIFVRLYV